MYNSECTKNIPSVYFVLLANEGKQRCSKEIAAHDFGLKSVKSHTSLKKLVCLYFDNRYDVIYRCSRYSFAFLPFDLKDGHPWKH